MTQQAAETRPVPQMVVQVPDPREPDRLLGALAIDRVVDGHALGGIRARPGVDVAEVAALAREMTLKCAFWGRRSGGAKAGIFAPLPRDAGERREVFRRFGQGIAPVLQRDLYWTGTDMGTYPEDLRAVMEGAGLPAPAESNGRPPGYWSSLSIVLACEALGESLGEPLHGKRVLIEGFGKLGETCARLLQGRGCRVVGVSTVAGAALSPAGFDADSLARLRREHGDDLVKHIPGISAAPTEALLQADADILVPCAGPYTFDAGNIARVRARWVVPGSNLTTRHGHEDAWHRHGIRYFPGYVSNAGEIFVPVVWSQVRSEARVEAAFVERYRARLRELLARAADEDTPISVAAARMAGETLAAWERDERATPAVGGPLRRLARRVGRRLLS